MIIIIGPPGSGKNTQIDLIKKKLNYKVFSLGDYLRNLTNSKHALAVKEKINKGELINIELFSQIINQEITDNDYILNGLPRNIEQACIIDLFAKNKNYKIDLVINLEVEKENLKERLFSRKYCSKCNQEMFEKCLLCFNTVFFKRKDDAYEVILNRFEKYEQEKYNIENFYKEKKIYYKINANNEVDIVYNDIENLIINKI